MRHLLMNPLCIALLVAPRRWERSDGWLCHLGFRSTASIRASQNVKTFLRSCRRPSNVLDAGDLTSLWQDEESPNPWGPPCRLCRINGRLTHSILPFLRCNTTILSSELVVSKLPKISTLYVVEICGKIFVPNITSSISSSRKRDIFREKY